MERTLYPRRLRCETFSAQFTLERSSNLGPREFEGLASVFGSLVDTFTPTRVDRGAFAATLNDPVQRTRVKLLRNHDVNQPVGRPVILRECWEGLYLRGRMSDTPGGDQALDELRDGVIDELSIGFDPVTARKEIEPGLGEVRHLEGSEALGGVPGDVRG